MPEPILAPSSQSTKRDILSSAQDIRVFILKKIKEAIAGKFPIHGDSYDATISNFTDDSDKEISRTDEKKVILTRGSRSQNIYADIAVHDRASGKVVGMLKKVRVGSVPYMTSRHTMAVDGNEYLVVSQMRTKSGVYTRKRGNDTLESSFNLAKGANFRLIMDAESGVFKVDILGSELLAIAVLKILGANREEVVKYIGQELYTKNEELLTSAQLDRARTFLYNKLVSYDTHSAYGKDFLSSAEKDTAIRKYFSETKMDPETTKITLGVAQNKVDVQTFLIAMQKILSVYKGNSDVDERDQLEFQKIYCVEDLLAESIEKNKDIVPKIKAELNAFNPKAKDAQDKLKSIFGGAVFSKPVLHFLKTSSLSRLPTQINPVEFMDQASIITRLGEGAISSDRSVPFSTRAVMPSMVGLIDPIAGPESFKIGIDVHATMGAVKGNDNEFYKKVRNCRTAKVELVRAIDLYDKHVGFPDAHYITNKKPSDEVRAIYKGKFIACKRSDLDYQIPDPSDLCTYTTNTIPLMPNNQGNRLLMGDKHVQQALPLENPEPKLVKAVIKSDKIHGGVDKMLGAFAEPIATADGVIKKIDDEYVYIKGDDGKTYKVDYETDLPLASKTFLNQTITVHVGDRVKEGQSLGTSNFTKDGELTTGRNLTVAYMPYKGYNHEDGIVISEATAQKMKSVHADKVIIHIDKHSIIGKTKYAAAFPTNYTKSQLDNLDDNGIVKKGTSLKSGDPIIVLMESNVNNRVNQVLGMLNKSLMRPYSDLSEKYEMPYQAEVTDAVKTNSTITVVLKIHRPIQIGDKMAGSYGNKGVVAAIIPNDKMPHTKGGDAIDALLVPSGVLSRINPAQTLESALGKVAKKTGKKYDIENYSIADAVTYVKNELKKAGLKDKETVIDPETGKEINGVFVGVQHMNKLFKTSDTNYSARGIEGGYDQDESPAGNGTLGPKGMGGMEVNGLLASNTRALLQESTVLRGSKNAEFWKAFQEGRSPNMPREKKTFGRFLAILNQAGVNVRKEGTDLVAAPLTDKDIMEKSSGELLDGRRLDAKNLDGEDNGLFDKVIFGGVNGTRWGHINLAEPVVNPIFADAARNLLNMTGTEFTKMCTEEGGAAIKKELNKIDVDAALKDAEDKLRSNILRKTDIDTYVKKIKYLRGLKKNNLTAGDAYVLTKYPVLPPIMRPIGILKTGDIMDCDANTLYRNLVLQNNDFRKALTTTKMGKADIQEWRKALNLRMKEITGIIAPSDIVNKNRGVKGAVQFIAGDQPKTGYFYKKVISSKMNVSGRSSVSPDTSLGLNEIGLPIDTAWAMYKPFIIRRLTQAGYTVADARDAAESRSDAAKKMLDVELEHRPVIMNRAPTLWRHGMIAARPLLREGTNVRVNTIWEKGLGMDYDGDAVTLHLPVSEKAIEDTKKLFPTNQIFSDKKVNDIVQIPTKEPIFGLYKVTENVGKPKPASAKVHNFPNVREAWKAYYAGKLKLTDYVNIPW